ncbi:MAG: hypothetical protein QM578_11775 [Pantoea sp.]|uniref:hypothetical protein n=1 Tax=Pantoea sp. TaxID=69393 RepID=UPI0039E4741E
MTTSLFDTTPDTTAPSFDIEAIMQRLMAETGCSAQEAAAAVARQLDKRSQAKAMPEQSYFSLQSKEEKADYMRRIRENASSSFFMTPAMKQAEQADVSIAAAQAQFAENMKKKGSASPLHSTQAAIDFFRSRKEQD